MPVSFSLQNTEESFEYTDYNFLEVGSTDALFMEIFESVHLYSDVKLGSAKAYDCPK